MVKLPRLPVPQWLAIAALFVVPLLVAVVWARVVLGVGAGRGGQVPAYVVRVALPDGTRPIDLPPIVGPADASRPLVVIDAGHGGHDPGASGEGSLREKQLTLALALALRDALLAQGHVRVALTRSDDRFLALEERSGIARRLHADLFLSIHADSAGEKDEITGASIYTLSAKASSEAAARVAARENSADRVNGVQLAGRSDAVANILVDLAQRRTSEQSATFAGLIVREGDGVLKFHPDPRRSADFVVLRAPDVPSVLYEAGFISNPADAERLTSPAGQQRFATVMAHAIRIYFARQAGV